MRRRLFLTAMIFCLSLPSLRAFGQELLTNPSLELTPPNDGGRYTVAPGWTTVEGPEVIGFPPTPPPDPQDPMEPADYGDNGIVDASDYIVWRKGGPLINEVSNVTPGTVTEEDYGAWKERFGNGLLSLSEPGNFGHLLFDLDWHHWFQPYNATFALVEGQGFAHLFQDVPGTPGLNYTMTGWALFEAHYPGGVDNLNQPGTDAFPPDDGPPSPTDSFFALEFLDANDAVLAGSVEKELKADGQMNNTTWMQHSLNAVAPAGTVNVRVRASMVGAAANSGVDPQSFMVDLFSLTATPGSGLGAGVVPEPATWSLGAIFLVAMGGLRRRSGRHWNI